MSFSIDRIPAESPDSPPVLDVDHLTRQTFGDRDLQAELLGLFDRQARSIAASLAPPNDIGKADRLHTLVGSARAVGFFEVAAEAETLERRLRCGDAAVDVSPAALRAAVDRALEAAATVLRPPIA